MTEIEENKFRGAVLTKLEKLQKIEESLTTRIEQIEVNTFVNKELNECLQKNSEAVKGLSDSLGQLEGNIKTVNNRLDKLATEINANTDTLEPIREDVKEIVERTTLVDKEQRNKEVEELNQIGKNIRTFAEVLQGKRDENEVRATQAKRDKPRFTVLCRAKTEQLYTKNKDIICQNFDPSEIGVPVDRIIKTAGEGVLLEVEGKENRNLLFEHLKKNENIIKNFDVHRNEKVSPKIIIFGVDSELTIEEFEQKLIKQNPIFSKQNFDFDFDFKGKYGKNVVIRIDPDSFDDILGLPGIYLSWRRYSFREFISIKKCRNCGLYGHTGKFCKNYKVCQDCSERWTEDHVCNETNTRCRACYENSFRLESKPNFDHRNFVPSCPSFKRAEFVAKRYIDYCD